MQCTPEILDRLKEEIESTPYGIVSITLNEKGSYVEITSERKQRIVKEPEDYHKG